MPTVSFHNRSIKDYAPLTMRFEHNKIQYHTKTKILVGQDFKEYYKYNGRDESLKNKRDALYKQTRPLEKIVLDAFYKLDDLNILSNEWLQRQYEVYLNPEQNNPELQYLTYWFDYRIENAHKIKNKKGGVGLSKNRIYHLQLAKERLLIYEADSLKRKMLLFDMSQIGFDTYKDFLFDLEFKHTSVTKILADLKSIGRVARKKGMKLPDDFEGIEIERGKGKEQDEDVIYLTIEELERIKSLKLKRVALINARKWFLLGCYAGQRVSDLMNKVVVSNFVETPKGLNIELIQTKGNKKVSIPAHPYIEAMFRNNDMPYKTTTQRLNELLKIIGNKAEINELINDQKKEFIRKLTLNGKEKKMYRYVKRERPKYEYLASHTARRTFCMMYYEKGMPIQKIMKVTGHSNEHTFRLYLNKSNDDHLEAFREQYDKIKNKN